MRDGSGGGCSDSVAGERRVGGVGWARVVVVGLGWKNG